MAPTPRTKCANAWLRCAFVAVVGNVLALFFFFLFFGSCAPFYYCNDKGNSSLLMLQALPTRLFSQLLSLSLPTFSLLWCPTPQGKFTLRDMGEHFRTTKGVMGKVMIVTEHSTLEINQLHFLLITWGCLLMLIFDNVRPTVNPSFIRLNYFSSSPSFSLSLSLSHLAS